jgi:hypothetical protein
MKRPTRVVLLLLLLAVPLLLQGASLPHTHFGDGLFNQEHDLTLLAIVGAVATLDASVPAAVFVLVVIALMAAPRSLVATAAVADAASRAPPIR